MSEAALEARGPRAPHSRLAVVAAIAIAAAYLIVLLKVERQALTILWVGVGVAALAAAAWAGLLERASEAMVAEERTTGAAMVLAVLVAMAIFHEDHFVLLLVATVLVYVLATLGLNIQFGYAGVVNFAGASFFGIGGYTAAVLARNTDTPHLVIPLAGALVSALIGSFLIYPVLRTRGHYAALITIAFALLFKTFLEVNDVLGGPQGLKVPGMRVLGWQFNRNFELFGIDLSFYLNYVLFSLAVLALAFVLVRRLERSWIGLNLDVVRLDETAAACYGLNIRRWKVTAFLIGNALIGLAGAIYAMMSGFVAPSSFTFSDSLILVSIVLLGGLGNPWGLVLAATIVVVVPEKLQAIQEYRFLLYAALVMLMLLFRPDGLLPRPVRTYFGGGR